MNKTSTNDSSKTPTKCNSFREITSHVLHPDWIYMRLSFHYDLLDQKLKPSKNLSISHTSITEWLTNPISLHQIFQRQLTKFYGLFGSAVPIDLLCHDNPLDILIRAPWYNGSILLAALGGSCGSFDPGNMGKCAIIIHCTIRQYDGWLARMISQDKSHNLFCRN